MAQSHGPGLQCCSFRHCYLVSSYPPISSLWLAFTPCGPARLFRWLRDAAVIHWAAGHILLILVTTDLAHFQLAERLR